MTGIVLDNNRVYHTHAIPLGRLAKVRRIRNAYRAGILTEAQVIRYANDIDRRHPSNAFGASHLYNVITSED